jgi:hypothetical protein
MASVILTKKHGKNYFMFSAQAFYNIITSFLLQVGGTTDGWTKNIIQRLVHLKHFSIK